jgi:hypothetical protein
VFSRGTDLTGKVDEFAAVGGIIADCGVDGPGGMVFCPVQTTGVAVVSAVVVGAPVGGFACVAVFAEFGAGEEGVEGVVGVDWRGIEDECLGC